jgi:S-formylglutathione hydrolase FrmB
VAEARPGKAVEVTVDAVMVAEDTTREPAEPPTPAARLGRWLWPAITAGTVLVWVSAVAVFGWATGHGRFDRIPLLNPALSITVELLAGAALIGSWVSGRRRWYLFGLPTIVLAAAAVTGAAATTLWLTETVTDAYPLSFALWVGMAVAALIGLPFLIRHAAMPRRYAAAAAVPLTLAGALLLVNDEYGQWPTTGDLLGHTARPHTSALDAQPDTARSGVLAALDPPATTSHFAHRPGSVYLPPAYFTAARTRLPVIIMLAGVPGATSQWPTSGKAVAAADAYAAGHHGLAPILLFVDNNGSRTGDTECVDGPRGNAETYLTVDVPEFATRALQISRDPRRWAVVGFSEGGTCAVDLTLRHPALFHAFVDLAGDARPTLGNARRTVAELFGGDPAALAEYDPAQLLTTRRYDGVVGWFAAGTGDQATLEVSRRLAALAPGSGLVVHQFTGVGAHNWQFASAAFARVLPEVSADLGLR